MRVRTIMKHINRYGPQPVKNIGRIYEATDKDAANLIQTGRVVPADKTESAEVDEGQS